jgi:hypothetical protein
VKWQFWLTLGALTAGSTLAREWEDVSVFEVNTDPPHSTLFTPIVKKDGELTVRGWIVSSSSEKGENLGLRYRLQDEGKVIYEESKSLASLTADEEKLVSFERHRVASPHHWSAEEPHLYQVVVELLKGGKVVQSVSEQTGFRRVERVGNQRLVNGESPKRTEIWREKFSPTRNVLSSRRR